MCRFRKRGMALGKRAWCRRKRAWCGAIVKVARGNTNLSVAVQPGLCRTRSETRNTGFLMTRLN